MLTFNPTAFSLVAALGAKLLFSGFLKVSGMKNKVGNDRRMIGVLIMNGSQRSFESNQDPTSVDITSVTKTAAPIR